MNAALRNEAMSELRVLADRARSAGKRAGILESYIRDNRLTDIADAWERLDTALTETWDARERLRGIVQTLLLGRR